MAKPGTHGEAMYFIGTVNNLKGEGIQGAKIDVVSIPLATVVLAH